MELAELLATAPHRGRPAQGKFWAQITRELEPQDFGKFLAPVASSAVDVKTLRATHHALARALAKGASVIEASAITGYTPARIGQLKNSPAFQELLAHYAAQVDEAFADTVQRMRGLSLDALETLQDRLDTDPDAFKVEELLKLATGMLDRTGHGPQTKVDHTHALVDADAIMALKARAAEARKGVVIDAQSYRAVAHGGTTDVEPLSAVGQGQDQIPGGEAQGALVRDPRREGTPEAGASPPLGGVV